MNGDRITAVESANRLLVVGTQKGDVYSLLEGEKLTKKISGLCFTGCIQCLAIINWKTSKVIAIGSSAGELKIICYDYPDSFVIKASIPQEHAFTALHWLISDEKLVLLSGNCKGMLFASTVTDTLEVKHSRLLIEENQEIFQISSYSNHVLIATVKRVVLLHGLESTSVTQVGVQERKLLGRFGAYFVVSNNNGGQRDTMLLTSRPGLRLWIADTCGKVQNTLLYKEAFQQPYPVRYLVSGSSAKLNLQFGPLNFLEPYLYTYSFSSLFILQPWELKIVLVFHADPSGIRRIALSDDTVFILTGNGQIFAVTTPDFECRLIPLTLHSAIETKSPKIPLPPLLPNKVWDEAWQTLSKITEAGSSALKEVNSKVKIPGLNEGPFILDAIGSVVSPLLKAEANRMRNQEPNLMTQSVGPSLCSPNYASPSTSPDSMSQSLYEAHRQTSLMKTMQRKETFDRISNLHYEAPLFAQIPRKKQPKKRFLADDISISSEESDISVLSDRNPPKVVEIPRQIKLAQFSPDSGQGLEIPEAFAPKIVRDFDHEELHRKEKMLDEILNLAEYLVPDSPPPPETVDQREAEEPGPVLLDEEILPKVANIEKPKFQLETQISHCEDFYTPYLRRKPENNNTHEGLNIENLDAGKSNGTSDAENSSDKFDAGNSDGKFCAGNSNEKFDAGNSNEKFENPDMMEENEVIMNLKEQHFVADQEPTSGSWIQMNGPPYNPITSIAVKNHFVYCTDTSSQVFTAPIQHSFYFKWKKLDLVAQFIAISPSGKLVIIIHKNVVYKATHDIGLGVNEWLTLEENVISIAVNDDSVWMVKQDVIVVRNQLSQHHPIGQKTVELPNDLKLVQITIWEGSVWGLAQCGKIFYRLGITPATPGGFSWHELDFLADSPNWNPSETLVKISKNVTPHFGSIVLTSKGVALGVDLENRVYWTSGISKQYPEGRDRCWWQVVMRPEEQQTNMLQIMTSKLVSTLKNRLNPFTNKSGPILLFAEDLLWFCEANSTVIWKSRDALTGFRWEAWHWRDKGREGEEFPVPAIPSSPSINSAWNTSLATVLSLSPYPVSMYSTLPGPFSTAEISTGWRIIQAGAMYKQLGVLWLLNYQSELFVWVPGYDLKEIELPCKEKLRCLAAGPEVCWTITHSGSIYIRSGMSQENLAGDNWVQLTNIQIGSEIQWTCVSLGSGVAWACDNRGHCWLRLGTFDPPMPNLAPAWVRVEDQKQQTVAFSQVYVGACPHMVWALDKTGRVYVREGIYPELPIGTSWVPVPSIQGVQLALSDSAAWVLSTNGEIYRRYGITSTNFVGDEWRKVPGEMSTISVSISDDLWGLRDGILHRQELASLAFTQGADKRNSPGSLEVEAEWEFV